jgi:Zn-dependent M28 family amino/carboxypeptidase
MQFIFNLLVALFLSIHVQSQNINFYKKTIHVLCNYEMEGRGLDSKGINLTQQFIVTEYENFGLKKYNANSYNQEFDCIDSTGKKHSSKNLIGVIDNHADSTIVFCAHYDHLDVCSNLSRELLSKMKCKIHVGADDNASGISLLLGLAKHYQKSKSQKYNYMFVALSAHEIGLYGSYYLFESDYFKTLKIKAFLNFDMVGRLNNRSKELTVGVSETEKHLNGLLEISNDSTKILLYKNNTQLLQSDATVFYKHNIPTLSFSTGITEDYHKTTDTEEKINYKGIKLIQNFILEFINHI